ncbi:MAG TPA: hypothetical protein VNP03_07720 [Pseudonocardia sp.]|nr:hypothetical protein [Pseudonocardia sp.]
MLVTSPRVPGIVAALPGVALYPLPVADLAVARLAALTRSARAAAILPP